MPNNPDDYHRIEEAKSEIRSRLPQARRSCRVLLEKVVEDETAELDEVIRYYSYCYPKPLLALAQDIQRQAHMYENILEEIKRHSLEEIEETEPPVPESSPGSVLRRKYESLGLIPKGNLPNPSLHSLCDYVTDKITAYSLRLFELLSRRSSRILQDAQFEAGVTCTLQVQTGWPLGFTIGVEFAGSATRA